MRRLLALVALPLTLAGCDASGDGDLFLLPPYGPSESFTFPLDSLVALPTRGFEMTFALQGSQVVLSEEFGVEAASPLGLTSYVEERGFAPHQIREVAVAGPVEFRLLQPSGGDLGFLEYAALALGAPGLGTFELTERTPVEPGATVVDLPLSGVAIEPDGGQIPAAYATEGNLRGVLVLRAEEAPMPVPYALQVSMPLRVRVNVAAPPRSPETFVTRPFDVREFLQSNGFEIGDVETATVTEVSVTPTGPTPADFPLLVNRAEVVLRAAGDDGDEAPLGWVESFDHPLEVSRDVTALVRRTGRVEAVIELDFDNAADLPQGGLSFAVSFQLRIEVPRPTASGSTP